MSGDALIEKCWQEKSGCGYTITECIRNRKLSLAAGEPADSNQKVIDVALKYGYDSTDSFTRVFSDFMVSRLRWFQRTVL